MFWVCLTTNKHTLAKKTLGWVRDVKFYLSFSLTLKLFLQDEEVTQNVISFSQSKLWKLFLQDVCRAHAFKWVFASSSSSVVTSLREEDLKNFPFQVEGGRVLRNIACVKRLRRIWRKVEIIILAPPCQLSNYFYVFEVPVLMLIIFFK